jgi:diguanylate cyclase (GGDEF)-like protein
MTLPRRTAAAGYVTILSVGLALCVGVRVVASHAYEVARGHYLQDEQADAAAAARHVQGSLKEIYENLRTLAQLPSVRNIDRHGANLGSDGRETIQQIYNNLANTISVSEVYIVPANLDPDKMDPVTGKTEEPIMMFDQLIVHAGRYAAADDPFAKKDADDSAAGNEPEEVETFEYHQLRDQFKWLSPRYPNSSSIRGLDFPMISGTEIITCDNTKYVKTMLDPDRSGILFSVPFFGPDDKLKGSVTAIILSSAIRQWLPQQNFALVNTGYRYVSRPSEAGQERASAEWVERAEPDPGLIYSNVMPLAINDPQSPWKLWAGAPDSSFAQGAEARAARFFETAGYGVIAALTLAGLVCWALVRRNINLVRSAKSVLEKRVVERTAEIRRVATHDALTGLPNRTLLHEKIEDALARVRRGETLAVLCLDLDHFKSVNDTLGHAVGDTLLRAVTARLTKCVRETDVVSRLGGDEFVVIQFDLEKPEQAGVLARRIIDAIAEPFDVDGHRVVVGMSVGIAIAPTDGEDRELLLRSADMALYRAKSDGRGACRFFEPAMDIRLQERRRLELDLRRALVSHEFLLHYQPLVDAVTEKIAGFEALLRWNHPEKGMISPLEFIPLAEEIGLIVPLGEWVLRKACADAMDWPADIKIAVNLSPAQFKQQTLVHAVASALAASRLAPARLELEITESVLLTNSEATMAHLHQLRSLGVRIVMDDFGTGYSSLSYLRSFPFDKIKIDRSFVNELGATNDCAAIVKAIAALGVSLGIETTAEGVETEEQLKHLRTHGCTEFQGYYFSRPRPLDEATELLRPKVAAVA